MLVLSFHAHAQQSVSVPLLMSTRVLDVNTLLCLLVVSVSHLGAGGDYRYLRVTILVTFPHVLQLIRSL